jgi:SAM-dependent methyltransferase
MKLHSPSAERNRGPILEVLRKVMPAAGTVLEVASGTGHHAAHFARNLPGLTWTPSDIDPESRSSIEAWRQEVDLPNLLEPLALDVTDEEWPPGPYDVVYCSNMIHITPWHITASLLDGASRVLREGGLLVTYGPYRIDGAHTAPSNEEFDRGLKERDPAWGVRDLTEIARHAAERGLLLRDRIPTPRNNFTAVFLRE